jgi:hypothetical protein
LDADDGFFESQMGIGGIGRPHRQRVGRIAWQKMCRYRASTDPRTRPTGASGEDLERGTPCAALRKALAPLLGTASSVATAASEGSAVVTHSRQWRLQPLAAFARVTRSGAATVLQAGGRLCAMTTLQPSGTQINATGGDGPAAGSGSSSARRSRHSALPVCCLRLAPVHGGSARPHSGRLLPPPLYSQGEPACASPSRSRKRAAMRSALT